MGMSLLAVPSHRTSLSDAVLVGSRACHESGIEQLPSQCFLRYGRHWGVVKR